MKKYKTCVRCGAVSAFDIDFGKMGKLEFCPICWVGLAGCMARDFSIFTDFKTDYVKELSLAKQREDWLKKNNKV